MQYIISAILLYNQYMTITVRYDDGSEAHFNDILTFSSWNKDDVLSIADNLQLPTPTEEQIRTIAYRAEKMENFPDSEDMQFIIKRTLEEIN